MNLIQNKITMKNLSLFLLCIFVLLAISGCKGRGGGPETETKTETKTNVNTDIENEDLINTAEIVQGRHRRETDYMIDFATHYLSVKPASEQISFSLHMADSIYEEAKLRECAAALLGDLTALKKASGTGPKEVTVYLVDDTGNSFLMQTGANIFCTLNDFESGTYREALCSAAYELTTAWQAAGLSAYAFDAHGEIDLAEYYAEPDHALTATCSAFHLSPLISDEQIINAARETARSMAAFLIQKEGFASFCKAADPLEIIPDWQKSAGIMVELPEGRAETSLLKVIPKPGYLAEIKVNNLSILIQEDCWLKDPDGLYLWIQHYYAGMDLVTDQIRKEVPSAIQIMEERLTEPIQIIFANEDTISLTYSWKNEISLSKGNAVWHEMVHLLLEELVPNESLTWECEAIAEHFSHTAETTYAPTRYIAEGLDAYLEFFADVSGKEASDDDMIFHKEVWRIYQELADPAWSDRDDLAAYCHAYGVSSLLLDEKIQRTQSRMKYDRSVAGKRSQTEGSKKLDGNALSYPESEVLFTYLASVYGMDAAVDAYMKGLSLQKAFGISYTRLLIDAKKYYAEQYMNP